MATPVDILRKYWGHPSFRPLQKKIINKVLEGNDVLALLPTGGGKSVCFQIPALLRPGICVVISPLVALMQDQVVTLRDKGIRAMALTGAIALGELDQMLDNCIYGNYKFLYLSPERLHNDLVQERIKKMNVSLIAVDEAHCISQWGHDFRPAYRNIQLLRELKPDSPIIALTATATPEVSEDIQEQLHFTRPQVIQSSFARPNITYEVQLTQEKNRLLRDILHAHSQAGIVYVGSRRKAASIAGFLENQGISATYYHGGLPESLKTERLQQWLGSQKRVMVATSAFGMGIDKSDVRTVIHLDLPENLESYFQQAGRAGRDGLPAQAIILCNDKDQELLKKQYLYSLPDLESTKLVYKRLMSYFRIAYGEGQEFHFNYNFRAFCSTYNLETVKTYNTLQLLERLGMIQRTEGVEKQTRIQVRTSHRQLQDACYKNSKFSALIQTIQRTYGGVFEDMISINLRTVCERAQIPMSEAIRILQSYADQGFIIFEHNIHDAGITFLVPREDNSSILPHTPFIEQYTQSKKKKLASVLQYVFNEKDCRSLQLLRYFGETGGKPCNGCDVCRRSVERGLSPLQKNRMYLSIKSALEKESLTAEEIYEKLPYQKEHIQMVLEQLIEKKLILLHEDRTYKLSE